MLHPAGSTFWNKTPKSQLPINRISSFFFFCTTSTGITESNKMQYGFFRRTNISKLNFASVRTGRMAGPASSTLFKLSLIFVVIRPLPLKNKYALQTWFLSALFRKIDSRKNIQYLIRDKKGSNNFCRNTLPSSQK